MFDKGAKESSQKTGPRIMLEQLQQRFPNNFDLPTESEIRVEITKLFQSSRGRKKNKVNQESQHIKFIQEMVNQQPTIKPKQGVALFCAHFESMDLFNDDQIRNRISQLKAL